MNYFNKNIIHNHDIIMDLNAHWVDHLNFLLQLSLWDDYENKLVEDEFRGTICYDV